MRPATDGRILPLMTTTNRATQTVTFRLVTSPSAGYGTRTVTVKAREADHWERVWRAAGHQVTRIG